MTQHLVKLPADRNNLAFPTAIAALVIALAGLLMAVNNTLNSSDRADIQALEAQLQNTTTISENQIRLFRENLNLVQTNIAELRSQLDAELLLSKRFEKEVLTLSDTTAAQEKKLQATLDNIETKVNRLVINLQTEIDALKGSRARAAKADLLLRDLTAAVHSGRGFEFEVTRLMLLSADDPVMLQFAQELGKHQSGVATHTQILREFDALVKEVRIQKGTKPEPGWLVSTIDNLRELVNVDGLPALSPVDTRIRDARNSILRNDLQQAIRLVESLDFEARRKTKEWIDHTQARLSVLSAANELQHHIDGILGDG